MKPLFPLLLLILAAQSFALIGPSQGQAQGQLQGQIAKGGNAKGGNAKAGAAAGAISGSKSKLESEIDVETEIDVKTKSGVKNSGNSLSASGVLGSGNSESEVEDSGNSNLSNSFDIRGDNVIYEDSAESAAQVYAAICTISSSAQSKDYGIAIASESQQCIELRQAAEHWAAYIRTKDKTSDQAKYHLERMHYFRKLADASAESGHHTAKAGKFWNNMWWVIVLIATL